MNCENKGHRPRTNKMGVTWCVDCGRLFTKPNKPLVNWRMIKKEKRND